MKPQASRTPVDASEEIFGLIETLLAAEQRLEELTGGEVDTVTNRDGRTSTLRRAHDDLRLAEGARQAAILNALPAHVALLDRKGVIVSVNDTWREFGTENLLPGPGSGVGLNYLEICDRASGDGAIDSRRVAAGIRSVLQGAEAFSLEYSCHSPTEQRWFLMRVTPLSGARALGVVVMHTNISERKRAEAAIEAMAQNTARRERILNTALSSMSDFAQIYDRAGRFVFANQPLLDLWGLTLEAVVGKNFVELGYPDELAAKLQRQVQEVLETKRSITDETPYTSLTGVTGVYEHIFSPVFGPDGTVDLVVGTTRDVTERKRVLQRLTEAQRIGQIGDWTWDVATQAITWSPQVYAIVGRDPGLGPPRNYDEHAAFYDATSQTILAEKIALAFATGEPQTYELRLRRSGGEAVDVLGRAVARKDDAGRVIGLYGTVQDITERKRVEAALEEREAELNEAQRLAGLGSWHLETESGAVRWSEETFRIFGRDPGCGAPHYSKLAEILTPESVRAMNVAVSKTIAENTPFEIEIEAIRPDQSRRWMLSRGEPMRDATGRITTLRGTVLDITERRTAEITLRTSNEKFHQLADNITDVFWIRSADFKEVHYVSPAFETVWGRSVASLQANPGQWSDFIFPEDRARVLGRFASLAGEAGSLDLEYRIVRPDGEIRWVHLRGFQVRNTADELIRQIGIVTDITDRKRLEDQIRQAQKMDAIGTLAGGIAHDFNNILAAITGFTELSQMILKENPEVRAHLGCVLQAAGRATHLVRQILTFSRQQPLERRPIQLLPVVAEALTLLRATIPSTIEFETSLPTNAPAVLADATQVHQILMNLGTNAWHAMKDQPGRLKVTLERCIVDAMHAATQERLRPGVYARVSVSDTGMGMNQETLRRIFEPFFTTKPLGEGTGLGLAVVHGIMDTHEGVITVYSQPGEGTVFHLYFPAHAEEAGSLALVDGAVARGQGERILLVDDEELLVALGEKALTALGYEVEIATQPALALAMVRDNPERFALIITDQTMSRMTGMALAGELRQIRPELPIILTSGYSRSISADHVEAAGIHQLLLKPYTINALGTAVRAALASPLHNKPNYGSNPPY